jgi:hypothetical protein
VHYTDSPPDEDGYKIITSPHPLPIAKPSLSFIDSFHHLSLRTTPHTKPPRQSASYGPLHTFTGFAAPGKERDTKRIDFVMIARSDLTSESAARGGWTTERYACVDNWIEEGDVDGWVGRWSDHRAVKVVLSRD